jgi:hypothetical protein
MLGGIIFRIRMCFSNVLIGANLSEAQNVDAVVFVAEINAAAPVDQHVLGLGDQLARFGALPAGRRG